MKISLKDLALSQPNYPDISSNLEFYVELSQNLFDEGLTTEIGTEMPEALLKKIALTLADYMQDIVADGGLWRSYILANRELYGYTVPFYQTGDEYVNFELNCEDVRFLVWYVIAMLWEKERLIHPLDLRLKELSEALYRVLDRNYEDAPVNDCFFLTRGLDFKDPQDRDAIFALGNWLFLHSYLLTPAYALTLQEMAFKLNPQDPDFNSKLNESLEQSMLNDTVGPLALFTPEWVYLMIEAKLPSSQESNNTEVHKYYEAFTKFTGGREIMYFDSYESLNQFFIDALGWSKDEQHLAHVKGQHDYTLMVDPKKGMLMAVNVARCIKDPDNKLYEPVYAHNHCFELLTQRGRCPGDLLKKALEKGWLPDARYPGKNDNEFVRKYADFIARCYLQIYYRGD